VNIDLKKVILACSDHLFINGNVFSSLQMAILFILWSQIIYGHRTASTSPKNRMILRRQEKLKRFLNIFLDIERCPVKFRCYLKFHCARTAFGRVIEGKMTSVRTARGRPLHTWDRHRTNFVLTFYRTIPTVPNQTSYHVWQAPRTLKNILTNPAPGDARPAKNIKSKIYISLEQEHATNKCYWIFCSLEQVWFSSPSLSESASIFFILTTCLFGGMMANFDINKFTIAPENSRKIGRAPYGVQLISYNAVRCLAGHWPMFS